MARKDMLAAGARAAQFIGGIGEGENLHKVSDEPRIDIEVEAPKAKSRKKFLPLGDILLVKQAEVEKSFIELTGGDDDAPAEGTVLDIGIGVTTIAKGQYVAFGKYSGTEIMLNGEKHLLIPVKQILGIIEDETPETDELGRTPEFQAHWGVGGCVGRA